MSLNGFRVFPEHNIKNDENNNYINEYLKNGGNNNIIHNKEDFYKYEPKYYDVIIDNPPFSPMPHIMKRLFEINKPFLIIMPISKLRTKYARKYLKDKEDITIIYPSFRFNYLDNKKSCAFETIALCYKMNLKKNNIWI